jgi:predicted nucleic acid-binding protein
MTTFFDTSAVMALHIESALRGLAVQALESPTCVSAMALTESLALIAKLTDDPFVQTDLEDALRLQWDRYAVVPVDQRCLDRAAQLLREQPLRLADAIQLAAADRLPRPITFVTFDPAQIPVALSLGFDVLSN